MRRWNSDMGSISVFLFFLYGHLKEWPIFLNVSWLLSVIASALCALTQEVQKCLLQLMCLNGCLTSPDVPGGEKLVVTACEDRWLTSIKVQVACADFNANGLLLPPQHVFTVKGFNRATCALLLMLACSEFPPLMEAGLVETIWKPHHYRLTNWFGTTRLCPKRWWSVGLKIWWEVSLEYTGMVLENLLENFLEPSELM